MTRIILISISSIPFFFVCLFLILLSIERELSPATIAEQKAVISATGASSSFRKSSNGKSIWLIKYESVWGGDEQDLRALHDIETPKAIVIERGRTEDVGMTRAEVKQAISAPNVVEFYLNNFDLLPADFAEIGNAKSLRYLNLDWSRFNLRTFSYLKSESIEAIRTDVNLFRESQYLDEIGAPNLRFLDIYARNSAIEGAERMQASPEGVRRLSTLKDLNYIRAHGLVIDEPSFREFSSIASLKFLELDDVCMDTSVVSSAGSDFEVEVKRRQPWPDCAVEPPRVPKLDPLFSQELRTVPFSANWDKRAMMFLSQLMRLEEDELKTSSGVFLSQKSGTEIILSFEDLFAQVSLKLPAFPSDEESSAEVGGIRWVRESEVEETELAQLNGAMFACIVLVFSCDVSAVWTRGQAFIEQD